MCVCRDKQVVGLFKCQSHIWRHGIFGDGRHGTGHLSINQKQTLVYILCGFMSCPQYLAAPAFTRELFEVKVLCTHTSINLPHLPTPGVGQVYWCRITKNLWGNPSLTPASLYVLCWIVTSWCPSPQMRCPSTGLARPMASQSGEGEENSAAVLWVIRHKCYLRGISCLLPYRLWSPSTF